MAIITTLPDLAKSFQAFKLANQISDKVLHSSGMFAEAILRACQSNQSPTVIIRMIKEQAQESPIDVANAIGEELTNKVLNF